MLSRNRILGATTVLAALGAGSLGWALVEAHQFRLRTVAAPVLRPGSTPRRLLHVSDLHLTPTQPDKRAWVRDLARLEPDLTVVTGDFLGHPRAVPYVLDTLAPLLERPGVFTLGSNDYFAPKSINPMRYLRGPSELDASRGTLPWPDLVAALTGAGWSDLDNRAARLDLPGWTVDARGVDDPHIGLDRYAAVAGRFDDTATLRLGVAHAPYLRVLDAMTRDGADLILAGHTHGGQVRVPGFGALVTNCDLDRRRAKGLSQHRVPGATSTLHVSAGLGTSPYAPIRFACPPEATLLVLTSS